MRPCMRLLRSAGLGSGQAGESCGVPRESGLKLQPKFRISPESIAWGKRSRGRRRRVLGWEPSHSLLFYVTLHCIHVGPGVRRITAIGLTAAQSGGAGCSVRDMIAGMLSG